MKRAINAVLLIILLSAAAAMLFPRQAHATGTPDQAIPSSANANAAASASAKLDATLSNTAHGGLGTGGSNRSESYSLVSSGSAAPLPSGLCPKGDSSYVQVLWGLLTVASSTTRTEMACLDKVLGMLRDTAPKPAVVNYLQPPISAAAPSAPVTVNVTQPELVKCEAPKGKPKAKVAAKKPMECKA
jgi:hypothetical protein